MKKLILVVLIIGMVVLSGCGSKTGSSKQEIVVTEPAAPKAEIKLSAAVGQISAKISPSTDEKS